MLLRSRILVIVTLATGLLASGIILVAVKREEAIDAIFDQIVGTHQIALWKEVVSNDMDHLSDQLVVLRADPTLVEALRTRDPLELTRVGDVLYGGTRASGQASLLEIYDRSNSLVYASGGAVVSEPTLDFRQAQIVLQTGSSVGGLQMNETRDILVTVAMPIEADDRTIGILLLGNRATSTIRDYREALRELCAPGLVMEAETTEHQDAAFCVEAYLVGLRGGLIAGTDRLLWERLGIGSLKRDILGLRRAAGGASYEIHSVPVTDSNDRPMAHLITAVSVRESRQWNTLSEQIDLAGAVVVMVGIALVLWLLGLWFYLINAFKPLNGAIAVLDALSRGDTSVLLDQRIGQDEIGAIAATVEVFRERSIAFQRADRQRLRQTRRHHQLVAYRQELDVATRLQASILPTEYPDDPAYELRAFMRPAREVGGDFYDFFEIDDERVGFVIADVSGKGVPAALFMAVARTLIKVTGTSGLSPGQAIARANDLLVAENEEMMFVTTFHGVLHRSTGRIVYANAGHNPPYVVRADGTVEPVARTGDMALGVMDEMPFCEATLELGSGDTLFLYTDGVSEAQNAAGEEFLESRLEAALQGCQNLSLAQVTSRVVESVERFVDGAEQSDDITCLALRYASVTVDGDARRSPPPPGRSDDPPDPA